MPNLDGLSALQALQQTNKRTRVIVLTASEDKNEFVQAMKLGCSGIVLKQTAPELIVKSIRKVHGGEIWLDSHTTAAVMRQFAAPGEIGGWRRFRQDPRALALEPARTRNRAAGRPGLQEQGNGREDVHQRADRQESPAQHLRQAGRLRPLGTGALRDPQRASPGTPNVNLVAPPSAGWPNSSARQFPQSYPPSTLPTVFASAVSLSFFWYFPPIAGYTAWE